MSIIFFLTEGMLRHMKINVSFGPSSGTDMSNFRPWLMDYITESGGLQSGFNRMKFTLILQSHCLIVKPNFIVTMKFNYPQSSYRVWHVSVCTATKK